MIKQFVPQEVCLKCRGCCRFAEEDSVWLPCLLEEEVQDLLDRKDIPAVAISLDKKIHPLASSGASNFVCPFLSEADNKCRLYSSRPFECQLYPFLINLRGKHVVLTVDLNCPYIKEKLGSKEMKAYIEELAQFLNSPAQVKILKENPQVIQAYENVLEVIELSAVDEIK